MNRELFAIRDYPSGIVLDIVDSWDKAREIIATLEEQDMNECTYSPGRYYITKAPQTK